MADSIGVVRIHQLPEYTEPKETDLLVIENSIDTWHITLKCLFDTYVKELVDDHGKGIIQYVHERLENIEVVVNNYTNIVNNIEVKFTDYDEAEKIRVENEKERISNEEKRELIISEIQDKAHDWEDEEEIRKRNELERISNENNRISNETNRINNEEERKTNEINRGVAENIRITNEDIRINSENIRIDNENNRITSFNRMEEYFRALSIAVNRLGNHGVSQPTTDSDNIVEVMEISLCGTTNEDYVALLHIQEGPDSNTIGNEGFFGLMLKFERSNDTVTGIKGIFSIPDRYKYFITPINFNLSTNIVGDHIHVIIEYRPTINPCIITFSRAWSNLSSYKHDIIPIYEKVLYNPIPKNNFSSNGINLSKGSITSYPQGFINFYNNIKIETNESIAAIKPITYWPVGSIYRTSSTENPADILGGGKWNLLYDGGIREDIDIDGQSTPYTVTVYEWERIS